MHDGDNEEGGGADDDVDDVEDVDVDVYACYILSLSLPCLHTKNGSESAANR